MVTSDMLLIDDDPTRNLKPLADPTLATASSKYAPSLTPPQPADSGSSIPSNR